MEIGAVAHLAGLNGVVATLGTTAIVELAVAQTPEIAAVVVLGDASLAAELSSVADLVDILVPEGTSMSALTVQVLRLSLSLGSVTAVNLRRSVCGAQGSLDR